MASISIFDLNLNGSELLTDSESFMGELTNNELGFINGGMHLQPESVPMITAPIVFIPDEPIICFAPEDF
jgi:hypothetical protein